MLDGGLFLFLFPKGSQQLGAIFPGLIIIPLLQGRPGFGYSLRNCLYSPSCREGMFSETGAEILGNRTAPVYTASCMSIRFALQVVARASAGSTDLTASDGTRSYECGHQRASAAAIPFKHRRFMQDSELPLTPLLGNWAAV